MKIIRTFLSANASHFPALEGVHLHHSCLRVIPGLEFGFITYPLVYPRLANRFFGFQVNPSCSEYGIEVGIWGTYQEQTGYFAFQDGQWVSVDQPVYHPISEIRNAIASWMGPMRVTLKISQGIIITEMSLGYEVDIEITDYLLRFAVPRYLSKEYKLSFISISDDLGQIRVPEGFNPQKLTHLQVQFLDETPIPASIINEVIIPEQSKPNKELQIKFGITPLVEFTKGLYQIEEVPTILVRELPLKNYINTYRQEFIRTSENTLEVDSPFANFDMPLELLVMTPKMSTSKAIAQQIMYAIREDGKIYIPPIDMDIGCLVLGSKESEVISLEGGEANTPVEDIKGNLATAIVKICLKRVDF